MRLLSEFEDTVAEFSCGLSYVLSPASASVLGCVDGRKWNGSVPECREIVSDQPGARLGPGVSAASEVTRPLAVLASIALALRL